MITLTPMSRLLEKGFSKPNFYSIPCFYDSHLHLQGLGKYNPSYSLGQIDDWDDLQKYFKGKTSDLVLEGFGLNKKFTVDLPRLQNLFSLLIPQTQSLYFVLEDGHQVLVYGNLLKDFFQFLKTSVPETKNQIAVFNDLTRPEFDSFYKEWFKKNKSPNNSNFNIIQTDLLRAQSLLLQKGITHCRDLTSDLEQFTTLQDISKSGDFKLFVETYFSDFFGEPIDQLITDSIHAKSAFENSNFKINHKGIKLFVDGTFSQSSVDCQCYSKKMRPKQKISKYNTGDLKDILYFASDCDLEVSVHTMGDLAVEKVIDAFLSLKNKFKTTLNLEHCELINGKTLKKLSSMEQNLKQRLKFHFQPSHIIMDEKVIQDVLRFDSSLLVFGWNELFEMGFKVHFGSDAPVTQPGLDYLQNVKFMNHFGKKSNFDGIRNLFVHPNYRSNPNTFSLFHGQDLISVQILGEKVF